jgi:hypothetical protein
VPDADRCVAEMIEEPPAAAEQHGNHVNPRLVEESRPDHRLNRSGQRLWVVRRRASLGIFMRSPPTVEAVPVGRRRHRWDGRTRKDDP